MEEEVSFDLIKIKEFIKKHYTYVLMALIMVFGLLYKIELLEYPRDYWHDEAFQFLYSEKPISFIINSMDVHPPLFNLLSKGIVFITGSELGTRYFMVFFSLIMLVTVYFYVSKVFGKIEALITCAILSTFPTWVFYATEFRSYMFVLMIIPIQMYFFYEYYKNGWKNHLIYCMLISVLLLYTHYFIALVFIGQAIFFIVKKKSESFKLFGTTIFAFILCTPLIIYFLRTIPKIEAFWFKEITLKSFVSTFSYLLFPNPTLITTIFSIIFYVIFIIIFVRVFFRNKIEDKYWLLICQGFLPILILYFVSQFHPIYHHRYFLFGGMSIIILFVVTIIKFIKSIKSNEKQALVLISVMLLFFFGGMLQTPEDFDFELRDSAGFLKDVIETDYFQNDYIIVHTSTFSQSPYKVYFRDNDRVKNLLLTNLTEKQLFTAGGSVIEKEEVIKSKDSLKSYNITVYFVSDKIMSEKVIWEQGGLYITRDKSFAEEFNEKWNISNE